MMNIAKFTARALIGIGVATAIALATPGTSSAADATADKLSHKEAASKLKDAGISWRSTGGCSDRNTPTCTSFSKVNAATIKGVATLKKTTKCAITITGGTEKGHAPGTYSHWNGYKLDLAMTSCLTDYITGSFTDIGGSKWKSKSGNIYYNESNHWDITFHNCGCDS